MKKKSKLLASLLSFCFTIGVLCFGVYAAQSVNYTVGGTLSYIADADVFASVSTNVYRYKKGVLEKTAQSGDTLTTLHTWLSNTENTVENNNENFEKVGTTSSFSTVTNGVISAQTEFSTSDLSLTYGAYTAGEKGYAYFIVVSVTNLGENAIGVTVNTTPVANTFVGFDETALNSNLVASESANAAANSTHNKVTNFVFAFGIDDLTTGVSGVSFAFELTLSKNRIVDASTNLTNTTWLFNDTIDWYGEKTFNVNYSISCANSEYNANDGTHLIFDTFIFWGQGQLERVDSQTMLVEAEPDVPPPPHGETEITFYRLIIDVTLPDGMFMGAIGGDGTIFEAANSETGLQKTQSTSPTTVNSITITGGADVEDSDLIEWLQANATLQ